MQDNLPNDIPEEISIPALFDLSQTLAACWLKQAKPPWQVIPLISSIIREIGAGLPAAEYEQAAVDIWIARSSRVAASASLSGPLIIGHETEIRHGAFIRGSALIGDGAVVGNSTELKNCILFNQVQVPHFNYIGDSILGYQAHLGAGAITSNVRGDHGLVHCLVNGRRLPTGLKKFGALVGDQAEVGCNTVLNPGSILGRRCQVYPLSMVRGWVMADAIYKQSGEQVLRRMPLTE